MIELKEHTCKLLANKTKAGNLKVEAYNTNRYVDTSEQVFMSRKNAEMLRDYLNKQYPSDGWISIDERLPEDDKCYLVWCGDSYGMDYFSTKANMFQDMLKSGIVTHWQPLPEPPRGEEI